MAWTDRRGFFRLLGGAVALLSGRAAAEGAGPLEIHRATRNTLLGAVGASLPRLGRPPAPFKTYPGLERQALPAFSDQPGASLPEAVAGADRRQRFGREPLSLRQVSRILHFTNGVTGGPSSRLRAAPSAGALYAGEVYLVAGRVEGLAPGVYYYAVAEHELVAVRSGSQLQRVLGAVREPGASEGAAAAILLTNVFRRYQWRYANRGYRYALIDSGHIGENLRLAASSAGLAWFGTARFEDDALNALLGVDGREEAVCAAHAIGQPAGVEAPAPRQARALAEKLDLAPEDVPRSEAAPVRYHEASKLLAAPGARAGESSPLAERPAMGPQLALPKLTPRPRAPVEQTIQQRRSATRFREAPVRLPELGFVLEMAQDAAAARSSIGVDLFLAAHRVEGVAPGLYQYRPRAGTLARIRAGDLRDGAIRACLGQEKAGRSAAAAFMVGRIGDAAARWGRRSYRELLIESGEIGQRIYLAAEVLGLAARNLAAFYDDDLNELLGLDGRREAVVHLTVFGRGE